MRREELGLSPHVRGLLSSAYLSACGHLVYPRVCGADSRSLSFTVFSGGASPRGGAPVKEGIATVPTKGVSPLMRGIKMPWTGNSAGCGAFPRGRGAALWMICRFALHGCPSCPRFQSVRAQTLVRRLLRNRLIWCARSGGHDPRACRLWTSCRQVNARSRCELISSVQLDSMPTARTIDSWRRVGFSACTAS